MRISHLFILLAASAMLTACDFLDEYNPNSVTVGNYYTSEEDIVVRGRTKTPKGIKEMKRL